MKIYKHLEKNRDAYDSLLSMALKPLITCLALAMAIAWFLNYNY